MDKTGNLTYAANSFTTLGSNTLVGLMDQACQMKIKIYFGLNIGSWLYGLPQRNFTPNFL